MRVRSQSERSVARIVGRLHIGIDNMSNVDVGSVCFGYEALVSSGDDVYCTCFAMAGTAKKYDVDEPSRMGFLKNIVFLTKFTVDRSQAQSQQPAIH